MRYWVMTSHDGPPLSDALDGYTASSFTSPTGTTHDVYRIGHGPAVIVIHEVPGITPLVAAFGRRIAHRSMTAVLPDLFGTPGRPVSIGYAMTTMARACVRREFTVLATNKTSPVVEYLRALASNEHERCGGPGVGAVGMCLTGGFALAMSVDTTVVAPVLSQPSLPLPVGAKRRQSLGLSDADLHVVKRRVDEDLCVMGLRFSGDKKSSSPKTSSTSRAHRPEQPSTASWTSSPNASASIRHHRRSPRVRALGPFDESASVSF